MTVPLVSLPPTVYREVTSPLMELLVRARWRVKGVEKVAMSKGEKVLTKLGKVNARIGKDRHKDYA